MMGREYINIPKVIRIGDFGDILQRTSSLTSGTEVIYRLSEVSFITPEMLMLLVTSSKLIYDKIKRAILWSELPADVYSYLERLDVGDLEFVNLKKPPHTSLYNRAHNGSKNLVELSEIKNWKEVGGALKKTRGVVNRWFPEKPYQFRDSLITLLKETVENSCEHSGKHPQEGTCYYAVQKYHQNSGIALHIAVSDVGVGMLESQRRVFPETKDDIAAICGALLEGKSGRKTGGGLGYYAIKEALGQLNGHLTIRSGQGVVQYNPAWERPKFYRKSTHYPGTQLFFQCRG